MDKEKLFIAVGWVLFAVVVAVLMIRGIMFMQNDIREGREELCAELSARSGYETELIGNWCYIQIRPDLKVREDQVLDFLPVIDCR